MWSDRRPDMPREQWRSGGTGRAFSGQSTLKVAHGVVFRA